MCGRLSCAPQWRPDLAHNPGMCPDEELNQRPLRLQAGAQSTEPHQPGLKYTIKTKFQSCQASQSHKAVYSSD